MPRMSVVPAISAGTATARIRPASTKTEIVRSRLAPISAKPLATSHEAAASGEAGEREQPGEREHVVAEPPVRRARCDRDEQDRSDEARRDERRGEPVDGGRALDIDAALAPQPPQLAVGLKRARAAAALEPRLPVLDEAGQKRREQRARRQPAPRPRRRGAAHPSTPSRAAASRTSTSAIR